MALLRKYFRFAKATSTGVQTVNGSTGFTGKALLLWSTHQTSLAATTAAVQSFGITDGVLQSCRFIRHPGGEAATTSAQAEQTDHIAWKCSATSGATPTLQAAGVFGAFTANGFTIDWTTNDSDADIYHAIVLGGDIEAELRQLKIDAASVSVTDLGAGFRPDCFVILGGASDESGTGDYSLGAPFGSIHGFGFSTGPEDDDFTALNNVCIWTLGRGTGGAADCYKGDNDDISMSIRVANLSGGASTNEMRIDAKADGGYTVERVSTTGGLEPVQHILALKGVRMAIRRVTAPSSTGTQATTLPFQPDLLIAQTINAPASDLANDMGLAMGVWERTDNVQGGSWIGGVDAANPSVYRRSSYDSTILATRNASSGSAEVTAAVSASSATSVTLNYTAVTGNDEDIYLIAMAGVPTIRGSFVAGVTGSVRASRAALFSLDGNVNELTEEGKLKVCGQVESTEELTVMGGKFGSTTVTLTDAQIKTLPTAPVTLVAAPGVGFAISLIKAVLVAKFSAGAYTGAADPSWIFLTDSDNNNFSNFIGNDSTTTVPLAYLTAFLGNTNKTVQLSAWQDTSDAAAQWGTLANVVASVTHENKAIQIRAGNGGVDFGGGNSANTLRVTVYYTLEAM